VIEERQPSDEVPAVVSAGAAPRSGDPYEIRIIEPGFDFYLGRVLRREQFVFVKRSHGFWDRLADACDVVPELIPMVEAASSGCGEEERRMMQEQFLSRLSRLSEEEVRRLEGRRGYKRYWTDDFVIDLLRAVMHPLRRADYFEAVTLRGLHEEARLKMMCRAFMPAYSVFHGANVWKQAAKSGALLGLCDALRSFAVILVGPSHLSPLGEMLQWPRFRHVGIHPTEAVAERETTLAECRRRVAEFSGDVAPVAILFQAGAMSHWLVYRLADDVGSGFLLDMGRALDVWFPEQVQSQPWFSGRREQIVRNMRLERLYS
jgi:hypothetical protein